MSHAEDFFSAVVAIGAVETLDVDAMRLLFRRSGAAPPECITEGTVG